MMNRHPLPTFDWREVKARAQAWAADVGGSPMVPTANHLLKVFGILKPPVPVAEMARALGASVHEARHFGSLEGALDYRDGRPLIWVNTEHSATKKRFTIAHEIGHLMLHPEGMRFREESYVGPFSKKVEERQANTFAAHLLMPLHFLEPIVTARKVRLSEVASLFNVSEASIKWQLESLL